MNIIGDVAGRFDELMELLKIMPQDEKILLVGDIIDRGPKSKEVIEWAMNNPNVIVLMGNHEDMMLDAYNSLNQSMWEYNGGKTTLQSYDVLGDDLGYHKIPKEHMEWMAKLPLVYEEPGLLVSHAPWMRGFDPKEDFMPFYKTKVLWNRYPAQEIEGTFQIHGHNTIMTKYKDYGICIDDSGHNKLTGIHWPSKQVFQVDYK